MSICVAFHTVFVAFHTVFVAFHTVFVAFRRCEASLYAAVQPPKILKTYKS